MKEKNRDFLNLNNTPSSPTPTSSFTISPCLMSPFWKTRFFPSLSSSNKSSMLGFVAGEIFIQGETGRGVKGGLSCLSPGRDKSYWGADKLVHGRAQHGLGKVVVSGWKWDKRRRKEGRICGQLCAIRGCNLGVSLQAISAPSGRPLSHSHTPGPRHIECRDGAFQSRLTPATVAGPNYLIAFLHLHAGLYRPGWMETRCPHLTWVTNLTPGLRETEANTVF